MQLTNRADGSYPIHKLVLPRVTHDRARRMRFFGRFFFLLVFSAFLYDVFAFHLPFPHICKGGRLAAVTTHSQIFAVVLPGFFSVRAVPCFEFLISSPAAPAELVEGTGLSLTGGGEPESSGAGWHEEFTLRPGFWCLRNR